MWCILPWVGALPFMWVVVARLLSKIKNMPKAEFYGKLLNQLLTQRNLQKKM